VPLIRKTLTILRIPAGWKTALMKTSKQNNNSNYAATKPSEMQPNISRILVHRGVTFVKHTGE
jgi:uncharacterized protein YbdZ (MbtH family)